MDDIRCKYARLNARCRLLFKRRLNYDSNTLRLRQLSLQREARSVRMTILRNKRILRSQNTEPNEATLGNIFSF